MRVACAAGEEEQQSSRSSELSAWDGNALLSDSELSEWSCNNEADAPPTALDVSRSTTPIGAHPFKWANIGACVGEDLHW